jgi:hypothetical protein
MVDGRKQYFFSHADPDAAALPQLHRLGPGVQVEHRGYVVAPPSLIWERHGAWLLDARPGRAPLAAMPSAWMDRLTGRQLPPNGLSGLDARHSIVGRAFETLGWLGRMLDDGRRIARCPWAREHTWPGGAGSDTATVVYSPECDPWFGEFACQHPECAERDATHLFEVLPREVLDAAYDALSVDMRPHTFAWDDELDLLIKPSAHALEAARELIGESGLAPAEVPNVGPDAEPPVCH